MIKVVHAGLQSSVQDLGRFGFSKYGIPISGVMDEIAFNVGAAILKNNANAACIETAFGRLQLQFLQPTFICITGADFSPQINNQPIQMHAVVKVDENDLLTFGKRKFGIYTTIHVKGGIQTTKVLGSRSYYQHVTQQNLLQKNDILQIKKQNDQFNFEQSNHVKIDYEKQQLDCYKGPEFYLLNQQQQKELAEMFSISSNCNRMGFVLHEKIHHTATSIISSAVLPGTVQLTPNGTLIILHKDAQTVGGYPRILQLTGDALSILSQKFTNDKIHFNIVDL